MNLESIWNKVKKIVISALDDTPDSLTIEAKFDDIEGWESLVNIEVISEVEAVFKITMNTQKLESVDSMKLLCQHIEECLKKNENF